MTMTTIRVKKDARYFSASNEPFNDKRLSWEARGLMGYLLSKPDNWELPDGKFEWTTEVYESPSQNPNPSKGIIKTSVTKRTSAISTSAEPHHILSTEETSTELNGADAPNVSNLPIDWQIGAGASKIVIPDDTQARRKDIANLIAMGMGANSPLAYQIALAFMDTREILIPESDAKRQRKAVRTMIEMGVSPRHVTDAVKKLTSQRMTVTDLFSVSKTAIDLANQAQPEPVRLL
jgi:hypothetical protein